MSVPLLLNDRTWGFLDSVIHRPKIAKFINVGSCYRNCLTLLFKTWIPCIHSLTPASSPSQPPFIKFNTLTKFVNQFDDVIFFNLKVLMLAVVQQKVLLKIKISSFYFICKWSQRGPAGPWVQTLLPIHQDTQWT